LKHAVIAFVLSLHHLQGFVSNPTAVLRTIERYVKGRTSFKAGKAATESTSTLLRSDLLLVLKRHRFADLDDVIEIVP
jgi:hypothetical protein